MLVVVSACAMSLPARAVERKTAAQHPMQYYVSLPEGWTAAKSWPVVVAIESANRDFETNLAAFEKARGAMPFIIVAPLVVTNGGANVRGVASYRYPDEVWERMEREGPFKFDSEGIAAVTAEVRARYNGEEKYFLTGWEAGGHTVWAMIFQHPEQLRSAAPVSFNYLGRWMSEAAFRSGGALPIRIFRVAGVPGMLAPQIEAAKKAAAAHGFTNVSEEIVNKPHGPLAEEVLRYFASLM